MQISRRFDAVTIRFDDQFGVRDAIGLPALIRAQGKVVSITLDFRDVRWLRENALATLIPALASMHRPPIRVIGLEGASQELAALGVA